MDVVEHHEAADGKPLDDVIGDLFCKALADDEDLAFLVLHQHFAELLGLLRRIAVDKAAQRVRIAGAVALAAGLCQIIIKLAVARKAQPLAQLHDKRR